MKSIAILTPKVDTFSNPTLTLLIEKLLESGYKILFFGYEQIFIPDDIKDKLNFYHLPFHFYKFYRRPYDVVKLVKQYYKLYRILKIENNVKTLICVDPMGLVIAGRIRRLVNLRVIYTSFEIFFEDEFFIESKKVLKKLEIKYSKKVELVVIQDKDREKLLKDANKFKEKTKFLNIPVSPKPLTILPDNYDIYLDLKIPKDKKIIVYSGTLQEWSGINGILNLLQNGWNSDLWLLVHSHSVLDFNDELLQKIDLLKMQNRNITFHNKPFNDFNDYAKFLSRCHVGIATYFPNTVDIFAGKNIEEIGLSSGKFATYMMLGIPTITTANSIFKKLNSRYKFGETIKLIEEIPLALSRIFDNYNKRTIACRDLYENELNPVSGIDNLVQYIEETYA